MLHIPILRRGEPYRSLEVARAVHYRTREPFVEVSQANVGLIRRDLRGQEEARAALSKFTVEELLSMCARAAEHFATDALGVVLPTNSPAVHALWTPAVALRTPLVLKPGAAEPWTPYRLIEAFARAGVPREAFGYYPTDHAGAGVILEQTGRAMMFGDASSVGAWKDDPRVELHGPGYSKIVIGEDAADDWERHLDVIARSVAENGGGARLHPPGGGGAGPARGGARGRGGRGPPTGPRAEAGP